MKRVLTLAVIGVTAFGVLSPADAASKSKPKPKRKPITKEFTATAPMPDPTNFGNAADKATFPYSVCEQKVPQSYHTETLRVPAAGKLVADLGEFTGDWDMLLLDGQGRELTASGNGPDVPTERMTYKAKKPMTFKIIACNWAGGSTAKGRYVFTFNN